MKKYFLVLFAGLCLFSCKKQPEHGTGLIYDEKSYLSVPEKAHLVTRAYENLPSAVNLMYYTPTPEDQGRFGTCVGWSTTFAAMTTCESIMKGRDSQSETSQQVFSPYYLFRSCNPSDKKGEGMYIGDALWYLKNNGVPKRNYAETIKGYDKFKLSLYDNEQLYKIGNYARLISDGNSDIEKIQIIKKSLSEKKPVVFGFFDYPESFSRAASQSDWYDDGSRNGSSGHAMVIVAYDDDHENPAGIEPGAFLIQNSWGTGWGWGGYIWVNYYDLAKYTRQAFELSPSILQVLHLTEPEPQPEPEPIVVPVPKPVVKKTEVFNGSFSLPLWKKDGEMEVQLKNNCYETTESFAYPTMFQLYMTNKKPCYVYAFASESSSTKANLIFPPENTSALLDYSENTVVYPSETTAIKLDDVSGTDYLIVLYSLEELDINQIMASYEDFVDNTVSNFDLYTAVKNAVGDKNIVSLKDTEYKKSSIDFSVKMEAPKTNKVLPVIIKIKHR